MSQLLELEIDIMYLMWVHAQSHDGGYTRKIICESRRKSKNKKIGPVGQKRIDVALDELRKRGHLDDYDLDDDGEVLFRITAKGIEWLEDWFRITQDGETYLFHRRREGPVIVNHTWEQRQSSLQKAREALEKSETEPDDPHFWTRWSTILTGLGIIVAVILALLAT